MTWEDGYEPERVQPGDSDEDEDEDDDDGEECTPCETLGGPPGSGGFEANPKIMLHVKTPGRFFIFVDQVGLNRDGRGVDGPPMVPDIGVALLANPDAFDDGKIEENEILLHQQPQADEGIYFACELEAAEAPYCIVPYLVHPTEMQEQHPHLGFQVAVYAAGAEFTLGGPAATKEASTVGEKCGMTSDGRCICWGIGKFPDKQNESNCIQLRIFNSLKRMERGLDRQLKYLDTLEPWTKNKF